jgi:hypothetical protein
MKLFIILVLSFCNSFLIIAQDDNVYYAKITNTQTYMNIDHVSVTEYWFSKDKYCTISKQRKSIVRGDLGVKYLIDLRSGTVRRDSIKPPKTMTHVEEPMDFKHLGLDYIPVYEWNKPIQLSTETVGKYVCEHFLCEGDADFDQISLEYLLAKSDDQFMADMMNSTIMNLGGSNNIDNKREPITGMLNGNNKLIPLRIIETVENPITPHITTTINVEKLELLKTSEGLFDFPDSLKIIN